MPWLLALALASCSSVETHYVPRTPHVLALGVNDHQLALYKDGALLSVDEAGSIVHCPPIAAELTSAVDHVRAARNYNLASTLVYSAGILVFPLFAVGAGLASVAVDRERAGEAALVDTVNHHNDTAACLR